MPSTDDFSVADDDMGHVLVPAEDRFAGCELNDASFQPPFIHLEPRHLGLPSIPADKQALSVLVRESPNGSIGGLVKFER